MSRDFVGFAAGLVPDGPSEGKALQRGQPAGAQGCAGGNLPVFPEQLDNLSPAGKGKPKPPWTGFPRSGC